MAAKATPGGSTGGRRCGAVRDRLDAAGDLPFARLQHFGRRPPSSAIASAPTRA